MATVHSGPRGCVARSESAVRGRSPGCTAPQVPRPTPCCWYPLTHSASQTPRCYPLLSKTVGIHVRLTGVGE